MTTPLLTLSHVHRTIGDASILRDISLSVNAGEIMFLLGASGCGKTTLLRIIAGFDAADSGAMSIGDRVIFDAKRFTPPQHRHLGYVLQEGVLFPHLSVYRNIAYGLGNGKGRTHTERQRIEEVMALTNISELGDRMPHEISGGQQQRVALARALAPKPSILLLDEPFSALDEHLRYQIRDDVINILRRSGAAAIIVTHDRREALSCADRVGIMQDGALLQLDTPRNICRHPSTSEVARFVNDTSLILPACLLEGGCCVECCLAAQIPVDIQSGEGCSTGLRVDGELLIRADQLSPTSLEQSDTLFTASVERIAFHGDHSKVELLCGGIPIRLSISNDHEEFNVGDKVGLKLRGKGLFYANE